MNSWFKKFINLLRKKTAKNNRLLSNKFFEKKNYAFPLVPESNLSSFLTSFSLSSRCFN